RTIRWPAREHARGPLVIARPLLRIVGGRISGAVVQQVKFRVVGYSPPHRSAADLPAIGWPARRSELSPLIVERPEGVGMDEHIGVGTEIVRGPENLASLQVEPFDPAVDAELAARGADDHTILDHQGSHRRRFTLTDISNRGAPHFPPC